ncbi:MAG TPA: ribonuclease J [Candidatus Nanoarchaeia archaeon]
MSRKFRKSKNRGGGKLRFIPLGGNGQVTKNMFVYEYGNDIILVDCGMGFPSEMLYGVDMVIPDISYLTDKRQKIRGFLITHGHEDHIGALPYIIDKISAPIYATKLTIGLIKVRLKEAGKLSQADFVEIQPRKKYQLGAFLVEPFRVSHSIPDSVGYAITSPVGTTIHTGDYKFDPKPLDGRTTDVTCLTEYGKRGVLALMSDCLRSEKPGMTLSESTIGGRFDETMREASGRVIITTFASNVSRIQQAIDSSFRHNRKVAIIGRSMEQNVQVAVELGYLKIPSDILVKAGKVHTIPDKNITLVVAGSQGQPGSALSRIASGDHKYISIEKGDYIIFSADPIPGNQDAVYEMIDDLSRLGAVVKYSDITSDFHVSGHAAQSELLMMLTLTRPKYLVPISSMHRQMRQFAQLAQTVGAPPQETFIIDEGEIVEFDHSGARVVGAVETTNVFVDGIGVGDVGSIVLRDRKVLAEEGIVVAIITVHKKTNKLVGEPGIISRGFVYMKESADLIRESQEVVKKTLRKNGKVKNWLMVKEKITEDLERFLFKKIARRPMVLPVIVDV